MDLQTDLALTRLSRGRGPAIHRYYDIPAESPDASHIIYFEWDGMIPGGGTVIVAAADGSKPQEVGRVDQGAIGHVGGLQLWLDDETIAFRPGGQTGRFTRVVSLGDGTNRDLDGDLRSYCEATGQAAVFRGLREDAEEWFAPRQRPELGVMDPTDGSWRQVLSIEQATDLHPDGDRLDVNEMNMMNAKFSPDGESLFVVFTDEIYRRRGGASSARKIKSLIVVETGPPFGARYLGEFAHHPMWTPDGQSVIAHRDSDDGQNLLRYPLDGGEPEVLVAGFAGVHTSLNAAQTHVITDVFDWPEPGEASLLLYELSGGEAVALARGPHDRHDHGEGTHVHPQWSRDESRIVFNHRCTGVPQLYAVDSPL